jgi:hypothetical protein
MRPRARFSIAGVRHGSTSNLPSAHNVAAALASVLRRPRRRHPTATSRRIVSDGHIAAAHAGPNLVNAWGIVFNPTGFVWVNAADGGLGSL